jgi:hypothetical protein
VSEFELYVFYDKLINCVGLEVLTTVTLKSTVFWLVILCSSERFPTFQKKILPPFSRSESSYARNQQKQAVS